MWPKAHAIVYRRHVPRLWLPALLLTGCTTVDPGPNPVIPDEQFDADWFFCKVEPELLIAKRCGPGEPSDNNSCHFNASAVGGRMALAVHTPVDCDPSTNRPTNRAQIGAGSAPQANLQAASLVMSRDYQTAPIYLRPTGKNHPRAVFAPDDPVVDVIREWARR